MWRHFTQSIDLRRNEIASEVNVTDDIRSQVVWLSICDGSIMRWVIRDRSRWFSRPMERILSASAYTHGRQFVDDTIERSSVHKQTIFTSVSLQQECVLDATVEHQMNNDGHDYLKVAALVQFTVK